MTLSVEQNKEVVRKVIRDFWTNGEEDLLKDLYDARYFRHDVNAPGISGHAGMTALFRDFRHAFPDLRFDLEDIIAEGEKVAARYWITGTHKGKFLNIPPTGRTFTITANSIYRLENGKVVEDWHDYDMLSFFQALGVISDIAEYMEVRGSDS